jgi:hypothetical protein
MMPMDSGILDHLFQELAKFTHIQTIYKKLETNGELFLIQSLLFGIFQKETSFTVSSKRNSLFSSGFWKIRAF